MTTLTLERIYYPGYTRGQFITETGAVLMLSQELPSLGNRADVSCIPEGIYTCTWQFSEKLGNVYRLSDTSPREAIDIHSGNLISEIKGCLEVGESYGLLSGEPAILDSKNALAKLHDYAGDTFILKITS
jgi:hypothetical protein